MSGNFGEEMTRRMLARGLGIRELGRQVHYNPGHLSNVKNGHAKPSPELARAVDAALSAGGALAALAEDEPLFNGSLSPDRRERIEWARQHPSRPDAAVTESLAVVLDAQRHAEDALGSAAVIRPVLAQLAVAGDLVREARGPARPGLVHVAAQWSQFAGWLLIATGKHEQGDARLSQALQWAVEAGDPSLISEALSFQGHAAYLLGRPGPVIGLSQAARRDQRAYPAQLAVSAAQEAKGCAMEGDGAAADRLLDEADELAALAREHPDEAPPWLYYQTDGFFELQAGEAYSWLAADPLYRERATEALGSGYAALPASARGSEWGAEYLVRLADVHVSGGDLEQACAVAMQAAGIARAVTSAGLCRMLRRLHARMARRWPGDPGVTALGETLR